MIALYTILVLIALTISIVSLVLTLIFLYKVPYYLDKISDALKFANDIAYRNYEENLDK